MISDKFQAGMNRQISCMREAYARGMRRRGWKVGINVPEVRQKLDLPHACVGWLDGDRIFPSGATIQFDGAAAIHVEAEVAIEVSVEVDPAGGAVAARESIAAIYPALELVNYRKSAPNLDDVVAGSIFHDSTVLGNPSGPPPSHTLGTETPVLSIGGKRLIPERSDLVAPKFEDTVLFVAEYLGAFGECLLPGDLILSGSYFAEASPLEPGAEVFADFGPVGSVSAIAAA